MRHVTILHSPPHCAQSRSRLLTVIVGVVAMLTLPTSQYPDIVPPEIMVQATYPGADAKTLAQAVATPVEQQMTGVDNMLYMSSVSGKNNGAVKTTSTST